MVVNLIGYLGGYLSICFDVMVDICLVKALGKIGTELGHNTPNGWISDQIS